MGSIIPKFDIVNSFFHLSNDISEKDHKSNFQYKSTFIYNQNFEINVGIQNKKGVATGCPRKSKLFLFSMSLHNNRLCGRTK